MSVEITGKKAAVAIGEQIKLGVKYTKEWGTLKSVKWTIPDTIVRNYTDGAVTAVVTPVDAAEKEKTTIVFHWVDAADGRTVTADCVFTSAGKEKKKSISSTFDVKGPTLDKFAAATDTVSLFPAGAPTRVGFGKGAAVPGIKWDWKVTVPSLCDAYIKDVQTIKHENRATTLAGVKKVRAIPGTKVPPPGYNLDTDNPYSLPGDYPPCPGFPTKVAAGGSFADTSTFDSPSNPLAGFKHVTIDRWFRYYLMYKPDKPDAIWVPVAKAEWKCVGTADLNVTAGTWSLSGAASGITAAGAVTTEFPTYTSNSKLHPYVDE
jgi:hypothetical protein